MIQVDAAVGCCCGVSSHGGCWCKYNRGDVWELCCVVCLQQRCAAAYAACCCRTACGSTTSEKVCLAVWLWAEFARALPCCADMTRVVHSRVCFVLPCCGTCLMRFTRVLLRVFAYLAISSASWLIVTTQHLRTVWGKLNPPPCSSLTLRPAMCVCLLVRGVLLPVGGIKAWTVSVCLSVFDG